MHAVFGAGRLLNERAGGGWGGWVWLSARAVHFWWGRSVVGRPAGCLVGEEAAAKRVWCLFGSCGWAAGVHATGSRLGPPIIQARRRRGLVIIDAWCS